MNTKNHQIRIVIYIIIGAVIAAVGIFLVLHSNNSQSGISLQDKLDLGHKYLVELSYDKAVLEFTDAIEIDPMNADSYLGLADAYIGQGDTDKAVEVLEKGYDKTADEKIKEKLDELKSAETTQNIETTEETPEDKLVNEYVYMYIPNMYIPNQVKSNNYYSYERDYHGYSVWTNWDTSIYYSLTGKNHECYLFSFVFPEKEDSIVKIDTSYSEIEIGKKYANSHITYNINENEKQEEWYDENGVLSEKIIYGKDTDEVHIHIKYDSYGNEIEYVATGDGESAYANKQTISYTYNEDGRIVKKVTKETNDYGGQTYYFTFTLEYFYDSKGNKTKCIDCVYDTDDEVHQNMVEYFYDDNNNLIKSVNYDQGNEERNYTIYEYDKYDNLISETTSSADGDETRTEYSYMRVKVLRSEVEKLKEDYGVELTVFEIE